MVWLLALFGMGGNITPLPGDASMLQRLPTPPKPPAERIGTLAQYSETGTRPLFSEDRRPQPFSLQPEGETPQEPSFDFILTSVLQSPGLQMAIVQPTDGGTSVSMKLGEAPEEAKGWRLVELHPRSAVFDGPEGQKSLELRTFDGNGGEAPTAVAQPQPSPSGRPAVDTPNPTSTVPLPTKPQPGGRTAAAPSRPVAPPTATAASPAAAEPATTPEAQMEAIRKRIEARRAQLRAQAQQSQQQPPAQKPSP
jgi:general secretion pathway protein N